MTNYFYYKVAVL